ncbi:predicted protein, partial [Nematostella vectensis]
LAELFSLNAELEVLRGKSSGGPASLASECNESSSMDVLRLSQQNQHLKKSLEDLRGSSARLIDLERENRSLHDKLLQEKSSTHRFNEDLAKYKTKCKSQASEIEKLNRAVHLLREELHVSSSEVLNLSGELKERGEVIAGLEQTNYSASEMLLDLLINHHNEALRSSNQNIQVMENSIREKYNEELSSKILKLGEEIAQKDREKLQEKAQSKLVKRSERFDPKRRESDFSDRSDRPDRQDRQDRPDRQDRSDSRGPGTPFERHADQRRSGKRRSFRRSERSGPANEQDNWERDRHVYDVGRREENSNPHFQRTFVGAGRGHQEGFKVACKTDQEESWLLVRQAKKDSGTCLVVENGGDEQARAWSWRMVSMDRHLLGRGEWYRWTGTCLVVENGTCLVVENGIDGQAPAWSWRMVSMNRHVLGRGEWYRWTGTCLVVENGIDEQAPAWSWRMVAMNRHLLGRGEWYRWTGTCLVVENGIDEQARAWSWRMVSMDRHVLGRGEWYRWTGTCLVVENGSDEQARAWSWRMVSMDRHLLGRGEWWR